MTRTQNSVFNVAASLGVNLLTVVLNFVTRSVFISTLGVSFLGVEGYFSNILTMLSMTELGFGTAIIFYLYKPIAENDFSRIRALMKLYKKIYRILGFIIVGLGLCLVPFLPLLVKDYDKFAQLGLNAVVIFLLYLFNSASSYWFFAYKSSFVTANQKGYILTVISYALRTCSSVTQILMLVFTHNFVLYLLTIIFFSILTSLVYNYVCDRRYPYLKEKEETSVSKAERKQIFHDCYALMLHRINGAVREASDNIVLTAVCGLDAVGLYSNYLAIKLAIENLLIVFTDSLNASIGNLKTAENDDWLRLIWRVLNFITFWLFGTAAIGTALLINDFITIWPAVGSDFVVTQWTGANGVVYMAPLALLIGIEIFFYGLARIVSAFRVSLGIFQPLKYRPIASILVNLAVSILTVPYWGMAGCVIGTIASILFTELTVDPLIIHRYALKESAKGYYLRGFLYTLVTAAAGMSGWLLCRCIPLSGVAGFIVHGFVCVLTAWAIFGLCFFRTVEFRYVVSNLLRPGLKKFKSMIRKKA